MKEAVAQRVPEKGLDQRVGKRIELDQDEHTLIDLNLTSTFVCTKVLGGAMIARGRGGRIINIASVSGLIANRGIGGRSYETGKAAVIAFTRAVVQGAARPDRPNEVIPVELLVAPSPGHTHVHRAYELLASWLVGRFPAPKEEGPRR